MKVHRLFLPAVLVLILLCPFVNGEEDTDGDGMPDGWEIENNLDPNDPDDAFMDNDADGYRNKDEYEAGSDPNTYKSYPGMENRMLALTVGNANFGIIRAGENHSFPVDVMAVDGHFDDVYIEIVDPSVFTISVVPEVQDISRDGTVVFIIFVSMPADGPTGDTYYSIKIKAVSGDIESNEERIYFGEEGEMNETPGIGIPLLILSCLIFTLLISYFQRKR